VKLKFILLFFIILFVNCLHIFANGEQDSDRFTFENVNNSIIASSYIIGKASTDNESIHEAKIIIDSYNENAINDIIIESDIISESIHIFRNQLNESNCYEFDSNLNDSNAGFIISVEWYDPVYNGISISIKKKPISGNKGIFLNQNSINIKSNVTLFSDHIKSYLFGYLADGSNIEVAGSDALLRLTIPPEIIVQPGNNPINVKQGNSIYFKSFINKTEKSVLSYYWDFSGQSIISDFKDPGFIEFNNHGTSTMIFTVSDDLGISSSYQTEIDVIQNYPPSTPDLLYPLDNDQILVSDLVFYWTPSEDLENEEITYDVLISKNINFSDSIKISYLLPIIIMTFIPFLLIPYKKGSKKKRWTILLYISLLSLIITSCPSPLEQNLILTDTINGEDETEVFDPPLDSLSLTYSGLENDQDYYWKVIAKDSFGNKSESSVGYFKTE